MTWLLEGKNSFWYLFSNPYMVFSPSYLQDMFVFRDSSYNLRNLENKLLLPKPRTNYLKSSISYSGAVLWNSLPVEVRSAESLQIFKRKINEISIWYVFCNLTHGNHGNQCYSTYFYVSICNTLMILPCLNKCVYVCMYVVQQKWYRTPKARVR